MPEIDVSAMMQDFNNRKHRASVVAVANDVQAEKDLATETIEKTGAEVITGHDIVAGQEPSLEEQLAVSLSAEEDQATGEIVSEESDNSLDNELANSITAENTPDGWPTDEEVAEASGLSEESEVTEDEVTVEAVEEEEEEADKDSIIQYCMLNASEIMEECRGIIQESVKNQLESEGIEYNTALVESDPEYAKKVIGLFGDIAIDVLNTKLNELVSTEDETGKIDTIQHILAFAY